MVVLSPVDSGSLRLVLAELLGAEAQLAIYTGYSMPAYVPLNQSSALFKMHDVLEFANACPTVAFAMTMGDGPRRIFKLHRLEVGNEERVMTPGNAAHYELISTALRKAHPNLFIASEVACA